MHGPSESSRYPTKLAATLENARRQPGHPNDVWQHSGRFCGCGGRHSSGKGHGTTVLAESLLNAVGVTRFIATSKIGYDFVCHTGDLANFPFYYPRAYQAELELCATWLQGQNRPVIYDVGANGGFFSTHLAQMLAGRAPRIYALSRCRTPSPSLGNLSSASVLIIRSTQFQPLWSIIPDLSRSAIRHAILCLRR